MSRSVLDRRALLRGLLGGAAVQVALPPLEAMLDGNGEAFAQGAPIPKRFGSWFWAQGVLLDQWVPKATGAAWRESPPPLLAPLAERRLLDAVSIVTGTWVPLESYNPPHFQNYATLLSASPLEILSGPDANGNYKAATTGPSALDVIKGFLAGKTRFDEVQAIVSRAWTSTSVLQGNPASPAHNPEALYDQLFSAGLPGAARPPAGLLAAKKSVLDAVAEDAAELKARLGASDARRLEEHLASVRALERSVTTVADASCALPPRPAARAPEVGMKEPLEELSRALSDLVVYALACDLTRFFRFTFMRPQSNTVFWQVGVEREYHEWGHAEPRPQPEIQRCVSFLMKQLAYLVERLRGVPIGAGTLLDHCCVWAHTEVNEPRVHGMYDLPTLVIGGAGGALRSGLHVAAGGQPPAAGSPRSNDRAARLAVPAALHTRVLLTLMRALGMPQASFGNQDARVDRPFAELLV